MSEDQKINLANWQEVENANEYEIKEADYIKDNQLCLFTKAQIFREEKLNN
jgi:hypothetical protein